MPVLLSVLQYLLTAVVAVGIVIAISLGTAPAAVAPTEPQPQKIDVVATTTATTTLAVASSTPVVPKPAATTTKPVATPTPKPTAPVAEVPKVEDIKLTLNETINTITDLAASTTPSVNDRVRSALVNIICTTEIGGPFESISASGVIIDPRGVIITNAHAAQFFLLRDYPRPNFVQCIIRTGSPATPKYTAELLFISPSWIGKNAEKLDDDAPTGNGEHDYALLRITGTVSSNVQMPSAFPFVLTALNSPPLGTDVLVAGYAAGFLGGISVAKELYASSAFSKVGQVYTYEGSTIDLLSVGGTIVAQQGSSGGAVTTTDGTLVGVIVTSTQAAETANRDLRAIATSYILRDFESDRGKSLQDVLSGSLAAEAEIFTRVYAPLLKQKLVDVLEN